MFVSLNIHQLTLEREVARQRTFFSVKAGMVCNMADSISKKEQNEWQGAAAELAGCIGLNGRFRPRFRTDKKQKKEPDFDIWTVDGLVSVDVKSTTAHPGHLLIPYGQAIPSDILVFVRIDWPCFYELAGWYGTREFERDSKIKEFAGHHRPAPCIPASELWPIENLLAALAPWPDGKGGMGQ